MARKTHCEVEHRLVDVSAKQDASITMTYQLEQSAPGQLQDDVYNAPAANGTVLEHNTWVLNRKRTILPNNDTEVKWGLWSDTPSGENGAFSSIPVLTVVFDNPHTSAGISFSFAGDTFASGVVITWQNASGDAIAAQEYTPDGMTYFAERYVENFYRLVVQFAGTRIPGRRLKLAQLDIGQIKVWGMKNLTRLQILEEVDPISDELRIGTIGFTVYDPDEDFTLLNPAGFYTALQQNQELYPRAYVNGTRIDMGKYYLRAWDAPEVDADTAWFKGDNIIGVFEGIDYPGSPFWVGETAADVFAHIFAAAGFTNYTIDPVVAAEPATGQLVPSKIRKALQYACFAFRAACVVKRDGSVLICRLPADESVASIPRSRKILPAGAAQEPYISGIKITTHSATVSTSAEEVANYSGAEGEHTLTFEKPMASVGQLLGNATILETGLYYAKISFPAGGGSTLLTGYPYIDATGEYKYTGPNVDPTKPPNIIEVTDTLLVTQAAAPALALYLYDYYANRRITQTFGLILEEEAAGDTVTIETKYGLRPENVITRLQIDLFGGFLADCEVRG